MSLSEHKNVTLLQLSCNILCYSKHPSYGVLDLQGNVNEGSPLSLEVLIILWPHIYKYGNVKIRQNLFY